ncbi:armadillo repeat protein-like protein [Mollisia scopiformis]|uniref:Armadillo repeat protein-like protein n=1 Tax=Mollisia scopiformis TaxID=149040 RepID=A0A132B9N1_MOLSC|nr:armadillo repeat protein-like protein [Mollisia scopiformis]KUJ08574.1 armadillo repeat protein-like protein [Mollisia scopiformis]
MARQPWVAQIRNARTPAEQIATLRILKNEIVGHPLKKEQAVHQGVLDPVIRLTFNKSSSRQDGKGHDHSFASRSLSEEEMVRLQGLQVLASIALGGPPFLAPLQSALPLPAIYSNLCPSSNPSQLVLASLRALSNLADASALASNPHVLSINTLADGLFSRQHLASLCRILSQTSASSTVQTQISLAASLISRLCRDERHQQGLANTGVLDALATKLASFVAAEGLVLPGADILAQRDGLFEHFPQAAPSNSNMSVILEAIAVIIVDSKFRASQLLYSPSILAIFPVSQSTDFVPATNTRAAWNAFNASSLSARQAQLNAVDYLLPVVPHHQLKSSSAQTSAFPPLGTSNSSQNLALNGRSSTSKYSSASIPSWNDVTSMDTSMDIQDTAMGEAEEPESPLIAYLIFILRSRVGLERLMAASVLTVLYRAGLTNKTRETAIGLLVVPVLVTMLDESPITSKGKDVIADEEAVTSDRAIKERAPAILAMLITDSEYLQKAAFDAGVISKLSKMLKVSYDPVAESTSSRSWSPHTVEDGDNIDVQQPRLGGNKGQLPLLVHKIKVREATLKAIAALVPFKDEFRKAIVDQGMMPYIVESMSPNPGKPSPKSNDKSEKATNGSIESETKQGYGTNPFSVLVAACGAVRALSRSVSVLRTTLIDHGVAQPVFRLLQHPDIEVQIAATATVCNLLTDVSPMREPISEAGVLKILCEHARSNNAKLRLNALWALKHFVHGVGNDMKRLCLEELGQGWLVQLICDDTEDEALSLSRGNIERDHSPSDEMDEDVEMDQFEEQVNIAFGNSFGRSTISRPSSSRSKSIQQAELRLAALREAETNPSRKARKDDIAVQEQGLDFIRNLIGGAGQGGTAETTEMIDFLFNALGQDRFFEILASKLKPKIINPYNRSSPNTERKIAPPQAEIIIAVGYILVHMAASVPRHRQLVIAQTDLLKLLVPQFNHTSNEVRVALCWLVTNLTWMDDQNDGQACSQRANELKKLGFLSKLEMLEQDPELNVRERAKSALWQIKQSY